MLVSNIMLSIWDIPKAALMFAFYISYAGSARTPVLIAWGNELNAGNLNLRQLLVATANIISYAWVLWVPCKFWPFFVCLMLTFCSGSISNLRRTEV